MKKFLKLLLISSLVSAVHAVTPEEQQKEIQSLDERITDLELRTLKDKIDFGVDLKIDSAYMSDDSSIVGETPTSHNGYAGTVFFRINANAEISEDINIYTSVESLSYINENVFNNSTTVNSRENQDKGDRPTVSKAYFDWKFYKNWMTLSGGRLPTTQGPPAHIKDGLNREGTYPVTGYSIPLDGFALTTKLSTPFEMKDNLSLRLIYKPGGATRMTHPYRGAGLGDYTHPDRVAKNHQLYSGMLEFEQLENNHGLWGRMLAIMQFGYYRFGAPQSYETSGLLSGSDVDLYRVYFDNDRFLDVKILSPYLELNKVLNTPVDFYATLSLTDSESKARARGVAITGANAGLDFDIGPFLHEGKTTGTRFLTGARYEIKNQFYIGAEYMKATEKAIPTVFYANSPMTPNYLNGKSYEVYLLKNVYHNNFIVRLGYTHVDVNSDISNGLFFRDTVEKINVVNLSFDFRI